MNSIIAVPHQQGALEVGGYNYIHDAETGQTLAVDKDTGEALPTTLFCVPETGPQTLAPQWVQNGLPPLGVAKQGSRANFPHPLPPLPTHIYTTRKKELNDLDTVIKL